jgi:hypothetical protein
VKDKMASANAGLRAEVPNVGNRVSILLPFLYVLSGCSALSPVAVVDAQPEGCTLLEELSFHRACDYSGEVFPEDVKDFSRLARSMGADTIECCRIADEVVVLMITNRKTGQVCSEARERFARAYRCDNFGRMQ